MDSYTFYKSIYDRELNRRKDLDAAINIPITILTVIVGINSISINKIQIPGLWKSFNIVSESFVLIVIVTLWSVFYLMRSYNNLFMGFSYRNLANTQEIRQFETTQIPDYNRKVGDDEKLEFESELIRRLNAVTDNHIAFNDKRSLDLYKAKTILIISLILTGIQLVIVTFRH